MPISGISTISSKRTIFVFEIVTSATLKKDQTNMTHQLINDLVSKRFLKQFQEEIYFF